MSDYRYEKCDMCGSRDSELLISSPSQSMTSDQRIVKRPLRKVRCTQCGLIREGSDFSYAELEHYYGEEYSLNRYASSKEHQFFIGERKVPRSVFIAEWIRDAMSAANVEFPDTVFEVGAGEGLLMSGLSEMFPDTEFEGCELSSGAVEIARAAGLNIVKGGTEVIQKQYELIYSFGVIEHVTSPKEFLLELRDKLKPGGCLLISQPIQDVKGYDIFFSDHLHHFHSGHIKKLAEVCGFEQIVDYRNSFLPNFGMHVLRKTELPDQTDFEYIPTPEVDATLREWSEAFRLTAAKLEPNTSYAIYGLGEVATLLFANGVFDKATIIFAIDDFSERYGERYRGIPVRKLDQLNQIELQKIGGVVITLRSAYVPQIMEKCERKGLSVINIF